MKKWFLLPQMTTFAHSPLNPTSCPTSYRYHPLHSTFRHILNGFRRKSREIVWICEKSCEKACAENCKIHYCCLWMISNPATSLWGIDSPRFRRRKSALKWTNCYWFLSLGTRAILCSSSASNFWRDLIMEWTTPQHEEIDLNCEVSSYANAEL